MGKTTSALVLTLSLFIGVGQAMAHDLSCGPRDKIVAHLKEKFGESQVIVGHINENVIMETWVSSETGTFTVMTTATNGASCLWLSGDHFQIKQPDTSDTSGDPA